MFLDEQVSNKIREKSKIAKIISSSSSFNGEFWSLPIGMWRFKMISSFSSNRLSRSVQWNKSVLSSIIGQLDINSFSFSVNLASVSCFNKFVIQFVTFSFEGSVFLVGCRVILAILRRGTWTGRELDTGKDQSQIARATPGNKNQTCINCDGYN